MKNSAFRTIGSVLLVSAMALSMAGCSKPADKTTPSETTAPSATTAPQAAGALAVDKAEVSFTQLGQAEAITATVGGNAAYDVTFTSADEAVAKVVGNVILAAGQGTTTVTAARESEEVVIMVSVATQAAVQIQGEDVVQLKTGDNATAALTAAVAVPSVFDNAAAGVTWTSSNPEVATVDAEGVVTAVSSGVANITASSNYQISTTTTQNVMGMTVTDTEEAIASDTITVMVNNEFDPAVHGDVVGLYEGSYDWQGFAQKASEDNACYTQENFQWIRAKVSLELKEDGTFVQKVLNAQRDSYPASIDQSLPESTFEEQIAKYGKNNCYIYNSFDQDPAAEEFGSTDKTFAVISGMESKGMHNFAEEGSYMILDGQLILFYSHVNGFTGEFEASQFVYGPVADGAYQANTYVPFKNMVGMNDNMSMVLAKAE